MSARIYEALGPLSPDGRAHMGVEIRGSGLPALPVVMVWVPERITSDPSLLAELQSQTASAVRLEHPHIIRVHGLEKLEHGWARVVEFADAESLRKLLDAGRGKVDLLWPAIAAAMVADACLGVHHAHETGEAHEPTRPVLHGGIRPETLLVDYKGRTKITGYGAAAFAPAGKDRARDAYTAPEQVLGGREAMTRQTDIYQLGAVLYECLTGVPPFTAEEGLLESLILTKAPAAHRLADQPELGEIALKALSKKASDRYPTALAMREALVACEASPPVSGDVVARWANLLFPASHPERVQRRELIKEALASTGATQIPEDLASALAEAPLDLPEDGPGVARPMVRDPVPPPAPFPMPAPERPAPPVAELAPELPAPLPARAAPVAASARPSAPPPAWSRPPEVSVPPPSHALRNGLIGVLVGGAAAAWVWYVRSTQGPSPVAQAMALAASAQDAGAADAGPADAGTQAAAAAAAVGDGGAPMTAAGAMDAGVVAAPVDAGPASAVAQKLMLEIQTDPPLTIKVDGARMGTGAVHARFAPGPHRVEAYDRSLHIFTARAVNLTKDHQQERISVGKAQLAFDVPAGATVTVDDKALGTAPVQPVELYAGTHEAVIEYNGAETVQRVPITADFNVTLTVHAH